MEFLSQRCALYGTARPKTRVGMYLLAWRMALAQSLLRKDNARIADVARRVGYSFASTFSVAFARHVGVPPRRFVEQVPADLLDLGQKARRYV